MPCWRGGSDDGEAELGRKSALGVVREDDSVNLGSELDDALGEALELDGGDRIGGLDIKPEELLTAADDAGLRRGGMGRGDHAEGVDAGGFEQAGELFLFGVIAPEAGEEGLAAKAGEVEGNIRGAAGAIVALGVAQNGNRGFGGDAIDFALDVAIKHDVADDKDAEVAETALKEGENVMKVWQHEASSSHFSSRISR